MSNVASIIATQIHALDPRAMFAWGAKDLMNMGNGLKFKTSGMVKWKGYVHIKLNGSDLYDIDFFRVRNARVVMDKQVTDIFVEDLVRVIDEKVG